MMEILTKSFGFCNTNCYILNINNSQIVIDPGEGSYDWIKKNTSNILGILCTHAHFDHIFDAFKFQQDNIKIYLNKDDEILALNDPFNILKAPLVADVLITNEDYFKIKDFNIRFLKFPGHTPGSSIIEVNDIFFSGDVVFKGSIGRYDFEFSSLIDTKKSIKKLLDIKKNLSLYPGHGQKTTLNDERNNLLFFLNNI